MDFLSLFTLSLYCGMTILTINFVWRCWKKESRLPLACDYEDLTHLISQSEKKIESLNRDQESLQAILKDKKTIEVEVSILQQQLQHYQRLLQQHQNELITSAAEREQQELVRYQIEELKSTLAIQRDEFTKHLDERKVIEQTADKLKRDIANFREISETLHNKIIKYKTTLAKLEGDNEHSRNIAKDLEVKIAGLNLEESTLIKKVTLHDEQLRHFSDREIELKILMEKRIQEISLLDETLKVRQAQIDDLNCTQSIVEDSVSKVLTRPYLDRHAKRPATEEADALKYLENYLQNEGLHFDQRTLYRFHTSLKITSHCPLVILSGISGTGKTLLAQSYATACGLHFLPMAVQPRWDSPQDLFGYYDFTKKQFAATELSRSLLQMDTYNRSQWLNATTAPQWIDDNLLMVLIDEMNIARVEHYFSELLSKLELRRNCIFSDNASRKKSEISLGNCILSATEQEVSLFIGYNILFVGTLNEDETTLALSDKILDRANVIHFGKPDSFSQKKKSSTTLPNKNMLSYETWKGWIKKDLSLPKDQKSKIDKFLDDFNKHMGEIGRPIGHRTYQAIIAYIANYPVEGTQTNWKEALVDQVEQKLMTRLRGVDLSSHHNPLSEIEHLVKGLEDEKLIQRYSKAKESSYFEWK